MDQVSVPTGVILWDNTTVPLPSTDNTPVDGPDPGPPGEVWTSTPDGIHPSGHRRVADVRHRGVPLERRLGDSNGEFGQ